MVTSAAAVTVGDGVGAGDTLVVDVTTGAELLVDVVFWLVDDDLVVVVVVDPLLEVPPAAPPPDVATAV